MRSSQQAAIHTNIRDRLFIIIRNTAGNVGNLCSTSVKYNLPVPFILFPQAMKKATAFGCLLVFGDPRGIRTPVTGVRVGLVPLTY